MSSFHGLDKTKGLDLFLHTPGGDVAATESIVQYIRSIFGNNVRAVIPQIAMSAGTMIACSCKEIIMGKHSNIGPIDPHLGSLPALGILEEFNRAHQEIITDPTKAYIWQPILAKYHPSLIIECEKAVDWSKDIVGNWLKTGMLFGKRNKTAKAQQIVSDLIDKQKNYVHSRHISLDAAKEIGLNVIELERDNRLQEAVLSVHHAVTATLVYTPAIKIIENHLGQAYIRNLQKK